jgi:large subunit ribosomal protein L4
MVKETKKTTTKKEAVTKDLSVVVYDLTGKKLDTVEVSKDIFGHEVNKALLAQYLRVYTQNQRQGTVSTKTRSEVVGTTKKLYRQKGTGRARHGSGEKANIFRGGGVTFGPKPREFALSMNKKQKKQALFMSLSMKMHDDAIMGLTSDALTMKPKTQEIAGFLSDVKLNDKKILFVIPKVEKNGFLLSTRNIKNVDIISASTLNPYEVLTHKAIIFVGDSIKSLEEHFVQKS